MQTSNKSNQHLDISETPQRTMNCPYNPKHVLQPRCFPLHIEKCRKKLPPHILKNFVVCRFNSLHIFSVYEIGAHEMTCPSKKNMIDLEQKLLETSKVLAEEISQVSQSSQPNIKYHSKDINENQYSTEPLNKNAQFQSNQHPSQQFFNQQQQFTESKYQMGVIMRKEIEQQNDLDEFSKNSSQQQQNLNISQQQSQIKKNIQQFQQVFCYNVQKQEKQREKKQLHNQREEKQYQQQKRKITNQQKSNKCKETYMIKNQITKKKNKIPIVEHPNQKLISKESEKIQKSSIPFNKSKYVGNKAVQIKKENNLQQCYRFEQKKEFNNKKNKTNNTEQFTKKLDYETSQQVQFHQCKQCGEILCNPDNRLWKNKKLLKYLKAYQKLDEEEQQIQQFLKYIPKYLKKQAESSKQKQIKSSQKQDLKISKSQQQSLSQKFIQTKQKIRIQSNNCIDQIKKEPPQTTSINLYSKQIENNTQFSNEKKLITNKIIKQQKKKKDVQILSNRSEILVKTASEINAKYPLKRRQNMVKIQQNHPPLQQFPNTKAITLSIKNKKQLIELDSFEQLNSQVENERVQQFHTFQRIRYPNQ